MRRPIVPGSFLPTSNSLVRQGRGMWLVGVLNDETTFLFQPNNSGPTLLPASLTINGTTVSEPDYLYLGSDAGASNWTATYGPALTQKGAGTNSYDTGSASHPFLDGSSVVNGVSTGADIKYYGSATTGHGPGTKDSCWVFVIKSSEKPTYAGLFLDERDNAASGGMQVFTNVTSNTFRLYDDSSGFINLADSSPGTDGMDLGVWNVYVFFWDSSDGATGARLFKNGASIHSGTGTAVSSATGDNLCIGGNSGFVTQGLAADSGIALIGRWSQASWFAGGAQNTTDWTAAAKEITAKVCGLIPSTAKGGSTPSDISRSTAAFLPVVNDSGAVKFHYVGSNYLRVGQLLDTGGSTVAGLLLQEGRTQYLTETNDLTGGNWSTFNTGVRVATGVDGPIAGEPVHEISALNGTNQHHISQSVAIANAGFSCFVKKHPSATNSVVGIRGYSGSGLYTFWFDFDSEQLTNESAIDGSSFLRMGDGWYWVAGRMASPAANIFQVYTTPTVGTFSYNQSGDGYQLYVQSPQVFATNQLPHVSYAPNIASSGTIATGSDVLEFTGAASIEGSEVKGTADVGMMHISASDDGGEGYSTILSLSDGFSNANRIRLLQNVNSANTALQIVSSEGASDLLSASSNANDGYQHTIRGIWNTADDDAYLYDDGSQVASDTNLGGAAPNDLDSIVVGGRYDNGEPFNGMITKVQIFNKEKTP